MDTYIIWNYKENRPAITQGNYGSLVVFLTKEQARAYLGNFPEEKNLGIKSGTLEGVLEISNGDEKKEQRGYVHSCGSPGGAGGKG